MDGTTLPNARSARSSIERANPWLATTSALPSRPVLLVFPHAGAGTAAYRPLARRLRDAARPLTVRLPGRETRFREPAYTDIRPLVRDLVPAVLPHLRGPFVLYGHSMGALVAFETARVLQLAYGIIPAHLVVSGMEAPRTLSDQRRQRHRLPDDQLWSVVREIGGVPPEMAGNAAARDLLLPVIRADFAVVDDYVYRRTPSLACPITAYAGRSDAEIPPDVTLGWDRETRAAFAHTVLPGDHFFNLDDASGFAQALRRLMHDLTSGPPEVAGLESCPPTNPS